MVGVLAKWEYLKLTYSFRGYIEPLCDESDEVKAKVEVGRGLGFTLRLPLIAVMDYVVH